VFALAFLLLTALTACGGPPPITSWPGYIVKGDSAYVASSDQILEIDTSPDIADVKRQVWSVKPVNNASIGYHSQPSLSEDGKVLFFGSDALTGNSGTVFALDINQVKIKWTYPLTDTDPQPGSIFGGIVRDGNVLYFAGGHGDVFALDAETGLPVWNTPFNTGTDTRVWSTPAVKGGTVFVASMDHHLYAIDKTKGTLMWKFPKEGDPEIGTLAGSPAAYDDGVYVGSFDSHLYAVGLQGELRWKFKATGRLWDPPAEVDGVLYQGDLDGNVYALDAATGQATKWPQPAQLQGGVRATPLVTDGVVYVGTDQFRMYALEADTGRLKWQQPFVARDGEMMLVTPALSGTTLVVLPNLAGSDPVRLYGLNKDTGALLWRFPPLPPSQ
jgi:outer membrane protein assembly factor BamB